VTNISLWKGMYIYIFQWTPKKCHWNLEEEKKKSEYNLTLCCILHQVVKPNEEWYIIFVMLHMKRPSTSSYEATFRSFLERVRNIKPNASRAKIWYEIKVKRLCKATNHCWQSFAAWLTTRHYTVCIYLYINKLSNYNSPLSTSSGNMHTCPCSFFFFLP
jgi:hypothetical protein